MKPLHQIIRKPLVTEKSNLMKEAGNVVAFEVAMSSNKVEIKKAAMGKMIFSRCDTLRGGFMRIKRSWRVVNNFMIGG